MFLHTKPRLALFDIDGVLADDRHRVQFALDKKWTEYFDADRMMSDAAWPEGKTLVSQMQDAGWTIGYLTGRRDDTRATTTEWLATHGFPEGDLIMRPFPATVRSRVPLANFKVWQIREILVACPRAHVVLFEDDPEVVRLVQQEIGSGHAVLCTWHVKPKEMIKAALA